MKCSPLVLSAILAMTCLQIMAAPKVAIVRVSEIYQKQPEVERALQEAKTAREQMLTDPRAEELRVGLEDLKELQNQISSLGNRVVNDEARQLAREFEIKRIAAKTLQEDFEKFRKQREKEINREMVLKMRSTLDRITEVCGTTARKKGFDIVLDQSGRTNTGLPMILYVKDAPDLTDDVIKALGPVSK